MSTFTIPRESKLNMKLLDSVKAESWAQTYSWTRYTKLQVKDETDRATLQKAFPTAMDLSFDDRKLVQEYIVWKKSQASQTPSIMSLDHAAANGYELNYELDNVLIESPTMDIVPACRVPMSEEHLRKNLSGTPGVRAGSDVMAASIASMTRWTGTEVTFSMPIDTMKKFKYVYAKPEGIQPLLLLIPAGTSKTGMKGRVWAYHLMSTFQTYEVQDYAQLMTAWCRAIFNLPRPSEKVKLSTVFEGNLTVYKLDETYHYKILYQKAGILGSFDNAYGSNEDYEKMAQQIIEFAAARQGDASGISMLSQSTASWGLVSKSQAELEQTVSLIVGMQEECTVVSGYSQPELDRIRASVARHAPKVKVWEKVEPHSIVYPDRQTAETQKGLYLIRGKTMIDTTLVSQRIGKIRTYQEKDALEKMWSHVERAVGLGPNVVFFAAGLPPKKTVINTFMAGNTWASVFFFSQRASLVRAKFSKETGLERQDYLPVPYKEAYAAIIRGMNNTVASWVVPPINRMISFSALLVPVKVQRKTYISYSPDDDEYVVEYMDEEEVLDPAEETDGSDESADSDQEQGEERQAAPVHDEPLQRKDKPKKATFTPDVQQESDV